MSPKKLAKDMVAVAARMALVANRIGDQKELSFGVASASQRLMLTAKEDLRLLEAKLPKAKAKAKPVQAATKPVKKAETPKGKTLSVAIKK